MALVTLAVIGKDNEPLYLRDFVQSRSEGEEIEKEGTGDALSKRAEDETKIETDTPLDGSSSSSVGNTFDVDDPFGFLTQELEPNESSSLKHQFMIHAALDRFEEITLAGDGRGWRTPGSIGANAMWIGLLCPIEELCIYGYLTNTGIKFLAVIEDTNDKQQQQSRESDLKHLFVSNNVSFSCFDKSLIYMHSDFIWCDRYCILLTGVDFYSKTDLLEFFFTC
uniref:Trafficking protein particle complex subunit n=1 Tax=Ditylum brightwellii TaxID=49249 RepID=A0A7S4QZU2_9STRA